MNDLDNYVKGFVSPLEDDIAELEAENKRLLNDKELLIALAMGNDDFRLVVIDLVVKHYINDKSASGEILSAMMEQLNIATDLGQKRFVEITALAAENERLKANMEKCKSAPISGVENPNITFCPNCECDRETTLYSEVRECTVCREGFEIVCGVEPSDIEGSGQDFNKH